MKNRFLLVLVLFFLLQDIYSQSHGKVLEGQKLNSKILGKEVGFSVYLPYDYDISNRSYPVVYLLHGYTDDEMAWVQFGEVNVVADKAIAEGEIPSMIIVMPDGGVSFYINDYKGETKWEDMFIQEFMPTIENQYRIRKQKSFRGISGLSMGGYGATILAMRHPELFSACAAFSSAFRTDQQMINMAASEFEKYGLIFGEGKLGKDRLTKNWYTYSALSLAEKHPEEELKKVRWYFNCGDDDYLSIGNFTMHIILKERKIPHEFRVYNGAHNWSYWRLHIIEGLKFIGESFHK